MRMGGKDTCHQHILLQGSQDVGTTNHLSLYLFRIAIRIMNLLLMSLTVISFSLSHPCRASLHLMHFWSVVYPTYITVRGVAVVTRLSCLPLQKIQRCFWTLSESVHGLFMINFTCKSGCQWPLLGTTNRLTTKNKQAVQELIIIIAHY